MRVTVVLIFGLVLLAGKLGLDVLLGGFVAGMIVRLALKGHELQVFESKLTAVGFGLVPYFFVTSGMNFDVEALGSAEALFKLGLFLALFLVIRARRCCSTAASCKPASAPRSPSSQRPSCPWSSRTTMIAVDAGHMESSTAAGLVGAAMLSTLIFPFVGLALQKQAVEDDETGPPPESPSPATAV